MTARTAIPDLRIAKAQRDASENRVLAASLAFAATGSAEDLERLMQVARRHGAAHGAAIEMAKELDPKRWPKVAR